MDILWVRWYGKDNQHESRWQAKQLPCIGFVPASDPDAFGFLDPLDVIRAVHLIPAFAYGKDANGLGPSIVRQPRDSPDDLDWAYLYVNMCVPSIPASPYFLLTLSLSFVDRDMFMRFRGGGVGHKPFWHLRKALQAEAHERTPQTAANSSGNEIDADEDLALEDDHCLDSEEEESSNESGEEEEEEEAAEESVDDLGPEDGENIDIGEDHGFGEL